MIDFPLAAPLIGPQRHISPKCLDCLSKEFYRESEIPWPKGTINPQGKLFKLRIKLQWIVYNPPKINPAHMPGLPGREL